MSIRFELRRTAQKSEGNLNDDRFLKPPKAEKQFLISPPASPPEGWKPFQEDGPCKEQPGLHFELVARLAALAEGQSHEIIEPSPIAPSIVLHACEVNLHFGFAQGQTVPDSQSFTVCSSNREFFPYSPDFLISKIQNKTLQKIRNGLVKF